MTSKKDTNGTNNKLNSCLKLVLESNK